MPKCAFCKNIADSREHIFSKWMSTVLPSKKIMRKFGEDGLPVRVWFNSEIDIQAKVVCASCNSWLGDAVENAHAKPALKDLISGKRGITISPERAGSIALFAFKTAIVLDHMSRNIPQRFFSPDIRRRFRENLEIPPTVMIWIVNPPRGGEVFNVRYDFDLTNPRDGSHHPCNLYVANFRAGSFGFQVVAANAPTPCNLAPITTFENLSIPLWPEVLTPLVWPMTAALTKSQFREFGSRWSNLKCIWT
jgi:hypothetical protein